MPGTVQQYDEALQSTVQYDKLRFLGYSTAIDSVTGVGGAILFSRLGTFLGSLHVLNALISTALERLLENQWNSS